MRPLHGQDSFSTEYLEELLRLLADAQELIAFLDEGGVLGRWSSGD